jgi:hypothetical protein
VILALLVWLFGMPPSAVSTIFVPGSTKEAFSYTHMGHGAISLQGAVSHLKRRTALCVGPHTLTGSLLEVKIVGQMGRMTSIDGSWSVVEPSPEVLWYATICLDEPTQPCTTTATTAGCNAIDPASLPLVTSVKGAGPCL